MGKSTRNVFLTEGIIDVFKGEYSEIRDELKDVFIKIGTDLGWEMTGLTRNEIIIFSTPISFKAMGEKVTINYSNHIITVVSENTQMVSWGKNDDNCDKYLEKVVPSVKNYLKNKESNRQSDNLDFVKKIKKEFEPIEINKGFSDLIKENQSKIEKEFIPKFLKIISHYEYQVKSYSSIFKHINSIDFYQKTSSNIERSVNSIGIYSKTIKLLELSIDKLLKSYFEQDLISFYDLFNKFEDMGLFLSKGEKIMVDSLSDINNNLFGIIDSVENLTSQMWEMGEKLNEINSSIEVTNLLSMINTYQSYKINQNTKT